MDDREGNDGLPEEGPGLRNGMSLIENVYWSMRDAATSGLVTLGSYYLNYASNGGFPVLKADYTYGDDGRVGQIRPVEGNKHLEAIGGALNVAAVIPTNGPTAGLLAKAPGKAAIAEGIGETIKAVNANSKESTLQNTLYALYKDDGTFLKYGITSKNIIEKRYPVSYMSDKYMKPLIQGFRAPGLKLKEILLLKKEAHSILNHGQKIKDYTNAKILYKHRWPWRCGDVRSLHLGRRGFWKTY